MLPFGDGETVRGESVIRSATERVAASKPLIERLATALRPPFGVKLRARLAVLNAIHAFFEQSPEAAALADAENGNSSRSCASSGARSRKLSVRETSHPQEVCARYLSGNPIDLTQGHDSAVALEATAS